MITGGLPRAEYDATLPSGRRVTLECVFLSYTYADVLDGDPSLRGPQRWYDDAVAAAEHHLPPGGRASLGKGIALIVPTLRQSPPVPAEPHVPYVRVLAFVTSWHEVKGSALGLVWFQDSFDEPLDARFRDALDRLPSWDAVAIPWED